MAEKYDSNGDYTGYGENFKRKATTAPPDKSDIVEDGDEISNFESKKAADYVKDLLSEKHSIDHSKHPNAAKLIDQEISKVQQTGKAPLKEYRYVDIYREKPIKVTVKVLVPVREHPKFNFVGKLLGPKGNSMKRLQEETMCKMAVLGRGSMKDRQKEEECRNSLDPKYGHLSDDLHVEISALGPPAEAHARVAFALAEVRKYLIPDNNDNIRQDQIREMEIMTSSEPAVDERDARELRPHRRPSSTILRSAIPRPPPVMRTATRSPVSTPRVMPAKTKILSILDRARVAMEESYGYESYDAYASSSAPLDSYGPPSYHHSDYEPEYDHPEYYKKSSSSYEPSPRSWKPYKSPPSSSSVRHTESSRYRTSPYTRPSK